MSDRYEKIREALAMGPTPGPFSASRSYSAGNQELILRLTYKDEYGLPEHYCTVMSRLGGELGAEANAALIAACDPDTIQSLLDERDAQQAEIERLHEQLRLATVDQATAEAEANDAHAENKRLAEALECMIIGACAVAVPHNGERAVLQDAVNIARAALAAYRKGGKQ